MKRRVSSILAATGLAAVLTACSSASSNNTAQYAHPNDPSTWLANADKEWAGDVEEATGGDVSINIHWSGALAAAPEAADAMSSGTSQIGILYPIYTPSKFPTWTWLSEYSFLSDPRPMIGDMQAYAAALEVSLNSDLLKNEYREQGIEPILPLFEMNAGYHLACTEPVTSLSDAKGKTVRTPGGPWERETTALGMAPTQMEVGEMYEALQRGVLDCSVNPLRDLVSFDLIEVATDITMDDEAGFTGFDSALGANEDWWDGLGAETQDDIWTTLKEYSERFVSAGLGADLEVREKLDEYDVNIHSMESDMRKALKDNQQERLDNAMSNAPEGSPKKQKELLTAYTEAMQKWERIITDELGYGEQIPATWSELLASDMSVDDVDFAPFSDRLWQEVLEPAMPSKR